MGDDKSSLGVGGRIPRARREPSVQLGQSPTRKTALLVIVPRVAYVLVNNAVGVEVRRVADTAIPTAVMPSQSR